MFTFADASIVVVTLEALFPVFRSVVLDVIVAVLISDPVIAVTLPIIVITPVHPAAILPPVYTKFNPFNDPVEIFIPVNPAGNTSVITIPIALFGPTLLNAIV